MVTTTHDPRSGGQPRLIVAPGDTAPQHASQREFDPVPGVTVIGSGPQADVRLEGFEAHHAEIRRDERDEYVYINLAVGRPAGQTGSPSARSRCAPATGSSWGTGPCPTSGKNSPTMAFPSAGGTAATRIRFWTSRGHGHLSRGRQRPHRR